MSTPDILWFVRAGKGASYVEDFIEKSLVAIGWGQVGVGSPDVSDEDLAQALTEAYPDDAEGARAVWGKPAGAVSVKESRDEQLLRRACSRP